MADTVMAAWDYRAAQVISACRHAGIAVPMQVAVCGMDNDEFICDSATPRLTSIRADRDGQGYAAAAALDALIDGRVPRIGHAPFRTATLVVRGSSAPLAPAASLVERALAFADENALSGIDAADVASHLGVSRRLLDLRFGQLGIPSISSALIARRLDEVKRLLSSTSFTLDQIAALSGFRNPDSLRNLFRRHFGISPRNYRKCPERGAFG
ncbi:MAG: substrate-binding domain-containing protein [Kiritimatiellae bacterium]|nr:substrate-binding domain-containing protein [Kiritimatiellia bacterium]